MAEHEQVEKVARAIYEASIPKGGKYYHTWEDLESEGFYAQHDLAMKQAAAAIAAMGDGWPSLSPELIDKLGKLATYLTAQGEYEACDLIDTVVARLGPAQGDGWQDIASARAAALEEAAVIAETWFDHHRPKQPDKSRFDIYDIQHWAKAATKLVAEDIRARIAAPPPGEKP